MRSLAALALIFLSAGAAAEENPRYVVMSLLGPEARGSSTGPAQEDWLAQEREAVAEIRREFGPQGPGRKRYVGYSVALLPVLNLTPAQLKTEVSAALDLAEREGVPVFFHLDDEHFWWRSPELSRNPEMTEWSDFPAPGEARGPAVPRYWLPWGDPPSVYPAAPPCLACPAFRDAVAERLRDCVAKPIAARLRTWRERGEEHLFAGLAAGNETGVPDFRESARAGWPQSPYGLDTTGGRPVKVPTRPEDLVPAGYHSLHALGYSRASIERLARERRQPAERVVEELFFGVARDYAEFQARTLGGAGLPKERLYTHFTSTARTSGGFETRLPTGRPGSGNVPPPFAASVNAFSRPGFTVVRDGVDLDRLVAALDEAGAPEHGRSWAAVESYVTTGQPGRPQTEPEYAAYLGGLLEHGARVVNVYGWNVPASASPYAIRAKACPVVPVVKRWLAGEPLPSGWSGAEQQARIARMRAKMEDLKRAAQGAVARGRNPLLVRFFFWRFQRRFDPLIQEGRIEEAAALVDGEIARYEK